MGRKRCHLIIRDFLSVFRKRKKKWKKEQKRHTHKHDLVFGQKERVKRTNEKRDQVLFYRLLFNSRIAKTKEKKIESVKEKDLSYITRRNK